MPCNGMTGCLQFLKYTPNFMYQKNNLHIKKPEAPVLANNEKLSRSAMSITTYYLSSSQKVMLFLDQKCDLP